MSGRDIQTKPPPALDDARLAIEGLDTPFPAHLQKYRHYIHHLNLSEESQRELLEALWLIMNEFVEHSFNSPRPPANIHVAPTIAKSRD